MAKNGTDAETRARWLAELEAVLREAEHLTTALAGDSDEMLEFILVRERILAAKNSLKSIEGRKSGELAAEEEPLWTMSPQSVAPRHDRFP